MGRFKAVRQHEWAVSLRAGWCAVTMLLWAMPLQAEQAQVIEAVINAPVAQVWRLFTTADGYREQGAKAAQVDLRLGGSIHLQDQNHATVLEEEILAFDPQHMLATRVVRAPQVSADPVLLRQSWTVIYFNSIADASTHVRIVTVSDDPDQAPQTVQRYLSQQRRTALDTLVKRYRPGCIRCEAPP